MGFFDDHNNVQDYIKMCEGYDPEPIVSRFKEYVPQGSSVLELGMGPGADLDLLKDHYAVTGSDTSMVFVERYRKLHPDVSVVQLDAVSIDTNQEFQGIFSNKVLQHLTTEDMVASFNRQLEILEPVGYAFHTLWRGDSEEFHHGLRFVKYQPDVLSCLVPNGFQVVECSLYKEMEADDSICLVLFKNA